MTKVVIPTSAAELEEMLNDGDRMAEVFSNKKNTQEFMRAYGKAAMAKDGELSDQIREQTQIVLAEMAEKNGGKAPKVSMTNGKPHVEGGPIAERVTAKGRQFLYNKRAPGAAADDMFETSADYFQAIWHHANTLSEYDSKMAPKRNALQKLRNSFGSEVPADGGFLIPEVLRSDILNVALETSIVRPRAMVIPMESLRVPIPMVDQTTHATSVFGGIVAYWTEEGATLTESQASFGRVVLEARKLTTYAEVPNELLADAPAFSGFFDQVFPKAIAFYEDYAFMQGDGTDQPLGYVNCPAAVNVAAESNQQTGTIVWENITKMFARMLPTSLSSAVWIASIDTFPQLATMALSVGVGGGPVWLGNFQYPGSGAPPVSILGRPVLFTEKQPTLSTQGDIVFADLGYYLIGDRQVMQASSSPHYKFANDKTAFRVIERVDGRPWLQSAITPKNSGPTITPFVQLATR